MGNKDDDDGDGMTTVASANMNVCISRPQNRRFVFGSVWYWAYTATNGLGLKFQSIRKWVAE